MALKSEIRKIALENRKKWSKETYALKNKAVCLHLIEFLKQFSVGTQVMSFKSIIPLKEVDLEPVHTQIIQPPFSFSISYPRVLGENIIAYENNQNTKFEKSVWGILEPEANQNYLKAPQSLDIVLVPLLAIDVLGNRVGYGKGFYDRFLTHVSSHALKVGVSLEEPVGLVNDINSFDIPMNYLISPFGVKSFS